MSSYALPYLDVQFVVKLPLAARGSYSRIVMHVASHTAQAYNVWTGQGVAHDESFYSGMRQGLKTLSYLRPYSADPVNATADRSANFASPWQHSSVRVEMCSRWEQQFLHWMHLKRVPVELLTSVDLHEEGRASLRPERYQLFVSVGHDEYWSSSMIRAVHSFVRRAGNAMFLGGNTMYWRVHSRDPSHLQCDKSKNQTFDLAGKKNQSRDHLGFMSSAITGLSFHGGQREASRIPKPANLYSAVRPDDMFFAHIAPSAALTRFGSYEGSDGLRMAISGYEADTIMLDEFHLPLEKRADAPMNFVALARETFAVIGYFRNGGGTVLNGASTDYAAALAPSGDPVIQRLTQNAISMLNTPAASRLVEVYEMISAAGDSETAFYYYSTTPFPPSLFAPGLQLSHTAFKAHLSVAGDRASTACRLRPFFSWERLYQSELLQHLSPHANVTEQGGDDPFELSSFGYAAQSADPLFFVFDPACRPQSVTRLRLRPIFQYVATNPLRFRYSPSRLPALVHWTLTGVAFFVPEDQGASVAVSRAETPHGPLLAYTVAPLPLSSTTDVQQRPALSAYSFAQVGFQVSTTRLHRGHDPVYRMRREDPHSGFIHFRLSMRVAAQAGDGDEEWAVDEQATPRGDGVLFYASEQSDPGILHCTPLFEYTRRMGPSRIAYAYDLGGEGSRLYTEGGYNASEPSAVFFVPKPLLVDVFQVVRQREAVASFALVVSPFLFSFALDNADERYAPDASLPSVRGRAGWMFNALSYPVADAVPVYSYYSVDAQHRVRYRYHTALSDEMVQGRGADWTGNGWILNTADAADGIAFYAFPSKASAALLDLELEPVYEAQHTAQPVRYVHIALVPASRLHALPPHYTLAHDEPLFYVPTPNTHG